MASNLTREARDRLAAMLWPEYELYGMARQRLNRQFKELMRTINLSKLRSINENRVIGVKGSDF